ncbi:ACL028Wp [Eremothecium gossypii ATCC 10895]|uniref:ACL028Wp n=1 Tax=Eremothecium gossypii (strain ATCC 10895 / CBS 109.51 / FGSC 9923 / NRRL Y-1056) TaxID=284811 RepID=Q75CD7_EREGS|nr:ACL028Wp [Eremothecium gossypii ATCC 10895]AAS51200.2 ACL028Wp [Eremothecium gossypii ATCC 10895]
MLSARRILRLSTVGIRAFSYGRSQFASGKWLDRPPTLLQAGQAIHESRPHMLKAGELTPGITATEYFGRRMKLAERMQPKSCAIIVGAELKYASGPVFYPFQQDNNLFYLTGWLEPDTIMVLEKPTADPSDVILHMFVPRRDALVEAWDGPRSGPDGAREIFNADESMEINKAREGLTHILKRCDSVYYDYPTTKSSMSSGFNDVFGVSVPRAHEAVRSMIGSFAVSVNRLSPLTTALRCIKSPAEIDVMRKAGRISGRAYNQAYAQRFRTERTLQAHLEYNFIAGGCDKRAYVPVVGAGKNALYIHYTKNDDVMYDDELVLVDAAGSLGGYCADISRTWPVSGKFSGPQKDLYEVVLAVQRKCISLCSANLGYSIHDIHEKSVAFMREELSNLGLSGAHFWDVNKIYPHYIGHNLGLDVHDVPGACKSSPLQEGQVITIEPGIYIPDEPEFPAYFRNIGIRIEDNIAVEKDTYRNLTVEAAKEIVDIESIAQNGVSTKMGETLSPLED